MSNQPKISPVYFLKSMAAVLLCTSICCTISSTLAARAEQRLATPAELHKLFDAGEYRICLQQIARAFSMTEPIKGYDPYDLYLLRGDCLMHLQDAETAQEAFTAATQSPDQKQAALARATAFLIGHSTALRYTPRQSEEAAPIDIVNADSRKAAFKALFEDQWASDQPLIDKAMDAPNLVPIQAAVGAMMNLQALGLAATGHDSKVRPVLKGIGDRARELIDRELDLVDKRISDIERVSNSTVDVPYAINGWWWGETRHGLFTPERHELRNTVQYLTKIKQTSIDAQQTARSFGSDGKKWEPIIVRATEVLQHARSVLSAE